MRYNIGTVVLSGSMFAVWLSMFVFVRSEIGNPRPFADFLLEPFVMMVPISFFLLYTIPSSFISLCVLLLLKFLGRSVNVYLVFWISFALSCLPTLKWAADLDFSLALLATIVSQVLWQTLYRWRIDKADTA